jgi:hypothetical protein
VSDRGIGSEAGGGVGNSYGVYEERPRRRRGRRLLVGVIVLLLVLGGLLVVADRVAAAYAARVVADQAQKEVAKQQISTSKPQVTIGGFPFLTQVLAGRYESISILVRDVQGPVRGQGVRLPELKVDARNVRASINTLRSGQGDVTAETVAGTGTITYDSVAKLINKPGLTLAEQGGQLVVTSPLDVYGQHLTVHGTANLTIDKGQVALRFDNLTADGLPDVPMARAVLKSYAQQISIRVPLPALPFKLQLQDVRALPAGLAVSATAQNLALNSVA